MKMLQTELTPLERSKNCKHISKSPITDFIRKAKASGNRQSSKTESRSTHSTPPIIQTRIPRAFQQVYIASNRGDDVDKLLPAPVREISRTRSCLSSRSLRASLEAPTDSKTTRTVSFGRVEGVTVENIARDNKNSLWFSRDEYSSMRNEAQKIAQASRKKGTLKESSHLTSRGLEKYIGKDPWQSQYARQSVLEHNDLAMYSLASNRAVHTARQLAELDALEALSIQQESAPECLPRKCSRKKLLNP